MIYYKTTRTFWFDPPPGRPRSSELKYTKLPAGQIVTQLSLYGWDKEMFTYVCISYGPHTGWRAGGVPVDGLTLISPLEILALIPGNEATCPEVE